MRRHVMHRPLLPKKGEAPGKQMARRTRKDGPKSCTPISGHTLKAKLVDTTSIPAATRIRLVATRMLVVSTIIAYYVQHLTVT